MLACFGGHLKVALQLHEHGALLDTKDNGGSGCLHWAVDGGKPGCIQWLLDNGIEVNREFSTSDKAKKCMRGKQGPPPQWGWVDKLDGTI